MNRQGSLFVITGPSGVGKGTLICSILPRLENTVLSRSATTRPMRDGEQQDREYNFLSQKEFDRRVNEGDFIEHVKYGSHNYGTLKSEVEENLRSGRNVILEIELEGARSVREEMREAVLIFIEPPSMEELHKRLAGRNTEESAEREVRLQRAREELAARAEFDYIVVNQTVAQAADDLEQIIKTSLEGGSS